MTSVHEILCKSDTPLGVQPRKHTFVFTMALEILLITLLYFLQCVAYRNFFLYYANEDRWTWNLLQWKKDVRQQMV